MEKKSKGRKDKRNMERRKEKSRDAARCRRSRETKIFCDLASVLPMPISVVQHLDKASIVRVAISYLKIRAVLVQTAPDDRRNSSTAIVISSNRNPQLIKHNDDSISGDEEENDDKRSWQKNLDSLVLNALDGFLVVISSEGDVIFISDNVQHYLGLSQVEILGQSIYELSHPCDHSEIKDILTPKDDFETDQKSFFSRMKCTLTNNKGRNLNMKSAAYKVIQYTGHLIKDHGNNNQSTHEKEHIEIEKFSQYDENDWDDDLGDMEELSGSSSSGGSNENNKEKLSSTSSLSYFIAIGEPVPHPSNIEIPLGQNMFLSKHTLDMKFTCVDEKINDFFGYKPEAMVKKSVFDYYHAQDTLIIKQSFKNLFQKGQSQTERYRFLALGGGYAWVLTQATVIYQDKGQKPHSVVCVNFVISGIEEKDCVYSLCQLEESDTKVTNTNTRSEIDFAVLDKSREESNSIAKYRRSRIDHLSSNNNNNNNSVNCRILTDKLHDLEVSPKKTAKSSSSSSVTPLIAVKSAASLFKSPPPPAIVITTSSEKFETSTATAIITDKSHLPTASDNIAANKSTSIKSDQFDTSYCRPPLISSPAAAKVDDENLIPVTVTSKKNNSDRIEINNCTIHQPSSVTDNSATLNVTKIEKSPSIFVTKIEKSPSIFDQQTEKLTTPIPKESSRISQFIFDDVANDQTPESNTLNLFVPIKEDMKQGFLAFAGDNDDTKFTSILDDEPEDLTHLAPTAGDVCVSLHPDSDSYNYILPEDVFGDIMLSDCNLLRSSSDNELNSNHSSSPIFGGYKNELRESETSSRPVSPILSHSGEDSNLASINGGDSPVYLRDNSIASLLEFGLVTSDDAKDLSSRASFVPFCLDHDALLPFITNDLMWSASSTDSSNWSSLSNSPRSNCSLSPKLDYNDCSSLAKLLKEDDSSLSPFSYNNNASSSPPSGCLMKDPLKVDIINDVRRAAAAANDYRNEPEDHHDKNNNNNNALLTSGRGRINDNNNYNTNDNDDDNQNGDRHDGDSNNSSGYDGAANFRKIQPSNGNTGTTNYNVRNNVTVANIMTVNNNNNSNINTFKRRLSSNSNIYNGKRGHVNNNNNNNNNSYAGSNGNMNVLKPTIDRKRSSTLIGNKRAFSDSGSGTISVTGYNAAANNNSNGNGNVNNNNNNGRSVNGANGGWKRCKQQQQKHQQNPSNMNRAAVRCRNDESGDDNEEQQFKLQQRRDNRDHHHVADGANNSRNDGANNSRSGGTNNSRSGGTNGGRFKQTDSVLMNLLVNGCDLNAGYVCISNTSNHNNNNNNNTNNNNNNSNSINKHFNDTNNNSNSNNTTSYRTSQNKNGHSNGANFHHRRLLTTSSSMNFQLPMVSYRSK